MYNYHGDHQADPGEEEEGGDLQASPGADQETSVSADPHSHRQEEVTGSPGRRSGERQEREHIVYISSSSTTWRRRKSKRKKVSNILFLILTLSGAFLEPPGEEILDEVEEDCNDMELEPTTNTTDEEQEDPVGKDGVDDNNDDVEPRFDDFSDSEHIELGEQELWSCTQPITVIKDISKKSKSRRASERRRSSELSDSETKDLIRLQRTVNLMKGERRSSNEKFFWDEYVPKDNNQSKDS